MRQDALSHVASPEGGKLVATPNPLRWFVDSMLGYWVLLLTISLGTAAVIYEVYLKGRM
jgi:hypothetical protein